MWRIFSTAVLAVLMLDATHAVVRAQSHTEADRVEEDWELVVAAPDFVAVGPQITTSMCPLSDFALASFVAFDLNYREYPSFVPGGMQLQVWSGMQLLNTSSQGSTQLSTTNETITWTQRMSVANGVITYDIVYGDSTSWGKFGQGEGQLGVTYPTTLISLVGYSPAASVAHSGVSWQSDHVTSMKLVRVRYYAAGVLLTTDTTPRTIDLHH
jgi:hypothetical protein